MTLDVFESQRMPLVAVAASAILTAFCAAAAWARGHKLLWAATALCLLVFASSLSAWLKKPRLLLRLASDGFTTYRVWQTVQGRPHREFAPEGRFFSYSDFVSVTLESRTAAFSENTREAVLRLRPRPAARPDPAWSHDPSATDFLVQASGQSIPGDRLLRLFETATRTGRVTPGELQP